MTAIKSWKGAYFARSCRGIRAAAKSLQGVQGLFVLTVVFSVWWSAGVAIAAPDLDGNGYVDGRDLPALLPCMSGPQTAMNSGCPAAIDDDGDGDADLRDLAAFQRARGHLPIPLRDTLGSAIVSGSTIPYSGRQTCGTAGCHNVDQVSNGFKFQQGRTDLQGNIIVGDDIFGDGRWWYRSPGRFGACNPGGGMRVLAAKQSSHESQIDLTTYRWVAECTSCHPGGGPGEFDRDGLKYFDVATGQFGYESLGKSADDVRLDGDYAYMDASGNLSAARWDVTGVSEPDCLHCHVPDPAWDLSRDVGRYTRRAAAAAARETLVDNAGSPVPAFASAGVAGQGWFSDMPIVGGRATKLQIDYGVGVDRGTLLHGAGDALAISPAWINYPPKDNACWLCHGPIGWVSLRGGVWFDDRDFHYAKLNHLLDADPSNDVPPQRSTTCTYCHPGDIDHNFAKGNSLAQHSRDELDWVGLRTCRTCHLEDSPTRHPDAPPVPGTLFIHQAMWDAPDKLSCQACHIPKSWAGPLDMRAFRDGSVTGSSITYSASQFYSADPVNPADPDKSAWYPGLYPKVDEDGVVRLFPAIPPSLSIYWGDWDQRGTPTDRSDDLVVPIAAWRFSQLTQGQPLPGVTDDNQDGNLEVNRPEEILTYIQALKGVDSYGQPFATRPVLVKGRRVYYEAPGEPGGVSWFDAEEEGIKTEGETSNWGINHNVRRADEAWGHSVGDEPGCNDCHRPNTLDSPVFDHKILIDPYGFDGQPVYAKVRQLTGLNPP